MSEKEPELRFEVKVVKLTAQGEHVGRVMDGREGMTFIVDSHTDRNGGPANGGGRIYHVRDYRYASPSWGDFCIWSLAPGDCEEVKL